MTGSVPIPVQDYLALPASPAALLTLSAGVSLVFFTLAGSVLGSTLILLFRRLRSSRPAELDLQLDTRILKALPILAALTITFSLAALLLTLVLYGPYYSSAAILLAWPCLAGLALLLLAFVSIYLTQRSWPRRTALPWLMLAAISFLAVLYIFTNIALLAMRPDCWILFHRSLQCFPSAVSLLPRLLHDLAASVACGALAYAWLGRYRWPLTKPSDLAAVSPSQRADHAAGAAMPWLMAALSLQIPLTLWFILSVSLDLTGKLIIWSNPINIAGFFALVVLTLAFLATRKGIVNSSPGKWLRIGTLLIVLGFSAMLIFRQLLPSAYLARPTAGSFDLTQRTLHFQTPTHPYLCRNIFRIE